MIEYVPASHDAFKLGVIAGTEGKKSITRIKSISNHRDVASTSINATSGEAALIPVFEEEWIEVSTNGEETTLEGDLSFGAGLRFNVINIDFTELTVDEESFVNTLSLSKELLEEVL